VLEVAGGAPAIAGDFEEIAGVGREVEDDFGGGVGVAFETDAAVESLSGEIAVACLRFQGANRGAVGANGWRRLEFAEEIVGQPVAEFGGADGVDVAGVEVSGEAGAGFAILGDEGRGVAGVVEEGFIGVGDSGHGFGLMVSLGGGVFRGRGGKLVKRWGRKLGGSGYWVRPSARFLLPS